MKAQASLSHPTRFSCRVVRGWLSVFGGDDPTRGRGLGSGHLAHCADCQRFFAASDDLAAALKRDAHRLPAVATNLESRISLAVHRSLAKPAPRRMPYLPFTLAGAGAALALGLFALRQPTPSPSPTVAQPIPAGTPTDAATLVNITNQRWNALKPSADALLAGEPLQREVDAVVADARSAVRFLELNFLPTAPDQQNAALNL